MFSGPYISVLVVLLPFPLLQTARATESRTNCSAVAVSSDTATINCKFPRDLNQTKRSFCIIQYGGGKKRTDVVTACSWENTDLLCVFEEGFRFKTKNVSTEFTVELPKHKGDGAFSCDTIPPDMNVFVEKCTMSLTAGSSEVAPSSDVRQMGSQPAHTHELQMPRGLLRNGTNENVSTTTTIKPPPRTTVPSQEKDNCFKSRPVDIAFIVILSLFNLGQSTALVWLCRRHKMLRKHLNQFSTEISEETSHNEFRDNTSSEETRVQNGSVTFTKT